MKRMRLGLMLSISMLLATGAAAQADTIRVQSTTDTVDAGLVDGYNGVPGLKTLFTQWEAANGLPADTLSYVAVGTGAALNNARGGLADVVITHAPSLEAQFVAQGYSYEPLGRAIFYSDYVIIGPSDDPAGVLTGAPHDAVTALEKIAAAGALGTATFDSRGDNSGTNVQEQIIWGLTDDAAVAKQPAGNGGGDATRKEPVGGGGVGTYPTWYVRTNKGQSANVQQCATTPGCYTMTDRGTFNRLVNSGTLTTMKVTADKNRPGDRGGENLLVNPFSAYILNPSASYPGGSPTPNVEAGKRLLDFLTSDFFQNAVDVFPNASDPAFRADAFPKLIGSAPTVASAGEEVALDLTLADKLPGGAAVSGMPVQLQQSTDGGTTFTNVGDPSATSPTGGVSFRPIVSATTTFRIALPRFGKFSPNTQTVGVVAVPVTVAPPVVVPDKTPPAVTGAVLSAGKLSLKITEPGTIKATIKIRKRSRAGKTIYVTVKKLTLFATKAGTVSHAFKALKPGIYHVTLAATDKAGNAKTRTVTLIVKAPKKKAAS